MSYFGKKTTQDYLTTNRLRRQWKASDGYDEPTYLGFKIEFIFNEFNGNFNNTMPHGLLDGLYTGNSQEYLKNQNQGRRASMLKEFNSILQNIQAYSPWVYTEISGLGEIYKLNAGDSYRAKDKILTIKFNETLDNRMAYALDLYRKIAFDAVNMKWTLPDIMRFFKMNVYVSEIRSFHQPLEKNTQSYNEELATWNNSEQKFGSQFQEYGAQIASKWNDAKEQIANADFSLNRGINTGIKVAHFINYLDANTSIMKFEFSECEFDINTFQLSALDSTTTNPAEGVTGSFNIKIGHIRESNLWSLWNVILSDVNVNSDNAEPPTVNDATKADMHTMTRGDNDNPNQVYDTSPYLNTFGRHLGDPGIGGNSITDNLLKEFETIVLSRASSAVEETIKKPILGNVYGFSASQTGALLQGGLTGAITAINSFTNNSGNSSAGDNLLANAYGDFSDAYVPPPSQKSINPEFQNLPLGSVFETDGKETATDPAKNDLGNIGFTGTPS